MQIDLNQKLSLFFQQYEMDHILEVSQENYFEAQLQFAILDYFCI